jgi:hypothetical protein
VAREVFLRDVATSKEVTVVEEGLQEAEDGHTLTAREGGQEGEAGDVSSAAKIVTAAQEGAQEVADACMAREVSSRLREVDTSKEVAVAQEGVQVGADAQFFTTREGVQEGEAVEVSLQTQEVDTSKEVAVARGAREGEDSARGSARGLARGSARGRVRGRARGRARGMARGNARGSSQGRTRGSAREGASKEVSAWNSVHAHATASAGEMTPLAQAPLERNLLVTPGIVMTLGVDGEQESDSCVSPSDKNFFQVNQFRSSDLLMVHQGCELLTVQPYSLQVVPQDSTTNNQADLILNMLLNINDECRKVIIIKLVSHADVHRSIEEVLFSIPIVSQSTFNKTPVNWEDCTRPYAVDDCAFWNHTRGRNKGLPHDPDPNVRTVGERMATSRAKTKVLKTLSSVGTEQQRLILLRVLSDPSIRDLSSSIGINMNEIKLGQQLLRCARKLIRRSKNNPDNNGG